MPNIDSAKKRVRRTAKRSQINHARKSRIRTLTREVDEAVAARDAGKAKAAFHVAESEIMRGVTKGVIHKNTGSRKVSRLAKQVAKLPV